MKYASDERQSSYPGRLASLLAALAIAAGCQGSSDDATAGTAVVPHQRTSRGDTTIVVNVPREDTATTSTVWIVAVGPTSETLGTTEPLPPLTALAPGSEGSVLAASGNGVYRVSADGVARLIGALHDPTEIVGLGDLGDGRIAVRTALDRIMLLDHEGEVLEERQLPLGVPPDGRDALVVTVDGDLFAAPGPWYAKRPSGEVASVRPNRPALVRLGPGLMPEDTVWIRHAPGDQCVTPDRHFQASIFEDIRVRYYPMVRWTLDAHGEVVAGCPARYELTLTNQNRPVRTGIDTDPAHVPLRERHAFQSSWVTQMQYGSGTYKAWGWRGPSVPETRPLYQRIIAGRGGRIWVWRSQRTTPMATPETWPMAGLPDTIWIEPRAGAFDVFEADGDLVGHVLLPEDVRYSPFVPVPDPVFVGDTLWAAVHDSTGLPRVGRFLVLWPEAVPSG